MKWIIPVLVYLAVGLGMFIVRQAWVALLVFHLAIVISLLVVKPELPIKTLITSRGYKWILINILLCGSSGVAFYFLWDEFGIVKDFAAQVEALGLNSSTWLPFIAYFTLVNPLIEEYFWRGYLGSPTEDLHASDIAYAGFHGLILLDRMKADAVMYALAMLVLAGWFWRQVARKDGGLLAPVLGHMAADFSVLLAVYLRVAR
jgi:membrane protease YdiL (CAAX protease family)